MADLKTIKKYKVFFVVWRGLFEPSTAPSRPERERVQTVFIQRTAFISMPLYFSILYIFPFVMKYTIKELTSWRFLWNS